MNDLDTKRPESDFIRADAELLSFQRVIDNLHQENYHLRKIIEMLITHQSPPI